MHLLVTPSKQVELAGSAARKTTQWWEYIAAAARGQGCDRCVEPRTQDNRFTPDEWASLPWSALAQAFLLQEQWWDEATRGVRGVSRHHEDLAAFVARQSLDMCSPSNFVATNPQVLAETFKTGGQNLAAGFANWLHDATAVATGDKPRGVEHFRPGKEVAVTPGQVVMRNSLVELIQYEPTTRQVAKEPVLIVPSWIMKYYILDLTPQDSLVRYLVQQGHTVFMVSWRNPVSADASLSMDDYLRLGVLDSIDAVRKLCPRSGIHAMGYCLGGTLLAIAAATLAGDRNGALRTVSLLAAETDFEEPGELGLFIDESQVAFLEDLMAERGYLDGVQMAGAFQLINSKDLVWSKLVHEYLMGAQTPMTALRAWNADATRLPAHMHSQYLRQLYLHNDLAEGRYHAFGKPVDLSRISVPMYVVATQRDHVSPWPSVYKIHHLVASPVEFVLASGGHNVGIVSPPTGPGASPLASFQSARSASRAAPRDPQQWLAASRAHAGSWWPHWHQWLSTHSSARIPARVVRPLTARAAMPAPGSYVLQE